LEWLNRATNAYFALAAVVMSDTRSRKKTSGNTVWEAAAWVLLTGPIVAMTSGGMIHTPKNSCNIKGIASTASGYVVLNC
jgi:hypothetical protein